MDGCDGRMFIGKISENYACCNFEFARLEAPMTKSSERRHLPAEHAVL